MNCGGIYRYPVGDGGGPFKHSFQTQTRNQPPAHVISEEREGLCVRISVCI